MSTASTATPPVPGTISGTTLEGYASDLPDRRATLLGMAAAGLGGAALTLVAWLVLRMTSWPAFNTSNMTYALSTAATIVTLVVVGALTLVWLLDEQGSVRRREAGEDPTVHRPRWRVIITYLVSYLSPAALVISTTAIPLSATRLYLDGVHIDQGFRTQFLTRAATTWANQDMNYIDLPSYYPLGWFWLGGRLAEVLGIPGWEVYQPWALISVATAACVLVPVWQRLTGSLPVAVGIALVTTCITLVMSIEEPYGAIAAMGVPAATIIAGRALGGMRFALIGITVYLGVSASLYTLYTGAVALSVVAMGTVVAALYYRTLQPIVRLAVIGFGSLAIASLVWGPFVWRTITGHPSDGSAAPNYLPVEGAQVPIPFLSLSVVGILCLLGLIWLVVRVTDFDVRNMIIGLVGFYLWSAASMVATLAGSTLLGFRVDSLIVLQLATAGVLALAELRLTGLNSLYPNQLSARTRRTVTTIMVLVLSGAGLLYAQQIPMHNQRAIDRAYSDTDGYGERADRYAADAGRYYPQIDEEIRSHGHDPLDTVVLTDEINFMAYHPYFGFQAFTSHYANPLGEFSARNDVIQRWSTDSWNTTPEEFLASLDDAPWRGPDVFILRGTVDAPVAETTDAGWKSHLAEDIYPNNPNVRYRGIYFNPEVFSPDLWHTTQIGPFVVASREIDAV
ncbi:galactan 5-O-arabinofuranosyltransferase [Corynebacterium sp.]|uniref:galactan 5-O-arabinofuranosyltransferase n=1 Tax=Corynebacterium sp. TaxID=1720 RepID=UPI0026E0D783|nr:galactan 5-O-arabinofuranosyltransferase [Corynebacterium sp.]MDO5512877.1 galactan 5-O-arabinofuranosyltransferase [Corynebacterium sp.]